ncbi:MAG TPA: hypothetical protein VF740_04200 [Candidatus Acidoferrum sp.]
MEQEKEKISDVEIEQKEEQPDEEKQCAAVNARSGQARNGIQHIMWNFFQARRVRARNVERADWREPRKAAVEKRNFVLHPKQKIVPVTPNHRGAKQKKQITAEGK